MSVVSLDLELAAVSCSVKFWYDTDSSKQDDHPRNTYISLGRVTVQVQVPARVQVLASVHTSLA